MDIGAALLCCTVHWCLLHLSAKDFIFYYHFLQDYKKATFSDHIFIHWNSFSARKTRLVGHILILIIATGLFTCSVWIAVLEEEGVLHSETTGTPFYDKDSREGFPPGTWNRFEVEGNYFPPLKNPFSPLLLFFSILWRSCSWISFFRIFRQRTLSAVYSALTAATHTCILFSGCLMERCIFWWHLHHSDNISSDNEEVEDMAKTFRIIHTFSPFFFLELSVASCSEEFTFRGVLTYIFRYRTEWVKILMCGLFFSITHIPKGALILCERVKAENRLEIFVAKLRSESVVRSIPADISPCDFESSGTERMEMEQTAAVRQQASQCVLDNSRLHAIQREVLRDLLLNLVVCFFFGILVEYLYLRVYQMQVAPLIAMHLLCNVFGVPNLFFVRSKKAFGKNWISWVVASSYVFSVAVWLKLVLCA